MNYLNLKIFFTLTIKMIFRDIVKLVYAVNSYTAPSTRDKMNREKRLRGL